MPFSFIKNIFGSKTMGTKANPGNVPRAKINEKNFVRDKGQAEETRKRFNQLDEVAEVRAAGVDEKQQREQQMSLADAIRQRAMGEGQSVAEMAVKRASDRNLAQQIAASRSGSANAANRRALMQAGAASGQEMAGQLGELRANEQIAAQQQLGNQLSTMRQQDQATQGFSAELLNSILARQMAMSDEDRRAMIAAEQLNVQNALGVGGQIAGLEQTAMGGRQAITGGLMQAAGAGLAMMSSDEDKKKTIKPIGEDNEKADNEEDDEDKNIFKKIAKKVGESLEEGTERENKSENALQKGVAEMAKGIGAVAKKAYQKSDKDSKKNKSDIKDKDTKTFIEAIKNMKSYTYNYKDAEKDGEGKHLSMMAQDLEKAGPIGKSMVIDTPQGKVVDYGKALGAYTALMSQILKKQEELEKRK